MNRGRTGKLIIRESCDYKNDVKPVLFGRFFQMNDKLCVSLVYKYLMQSQSRILEEFRREFSPVETDWDMADVVKAMSWENLIRSTISRANL